MAQGFNAISSRQRVDLLWDSATPLAGSATFSGGVRRIAGYGALNLFISSNLSFRIRIEEACAQDGPFTEVFRASSAVNDAGTAQIISQRFTPTAEFARVFIDNLSATPQSSFSACIAGLSQAGSGAGGGGDSAIPPSLLWSFPGTLATDQNGNLVRYKARRATTFSAFDVNLVTAPTGQAVIVEFHKLDAAGVVETLIATVTVPAGSRYAETLVAASLALNEEIFPLVTQVGSVVIGTTALMRAIES